MAQKIHKLIIVGSGPAGYTAGIYAARADLKPIIIEGQKRGGAPGGQLMLTTEIDNYPGFPEGIQGPELMDLFKKQAVRFGAQIISQDVTKVDFSSQPFKLETLDGQTHLANTVIIATGAMAKWLGLESEEKLKGFGVSACATCDGAFFRNKKLVVIGGGDSAMEEAIFLTRFATQVTIVLRRETSRASKIMQERAQKNKKINFIFNTEIVEIKDPAAKRVTAVVLKNNQDNSIKEMNVDGVFVAIGHKPNSDIFKPFIEIDDVKGYIKVKEGSTQTNIEGIFAAGDVVDFKYRQAVTAAGMGCQAALDAERYLAQQE